MLERVFNIAPGVVGGFVAPACGEGDAAERYGIVCPCQTHTANVGILSHTGESFPETDAIVTRLKGVRIGVRTADCVPVVLYAPGAEVIAAVHAGWKGTLAGIVRETLGVMSRLGADMEDMLAFFGPSICCGCFEVAPELATLFVSHGFGPCVATAGFADPITGEPMDAARPHINLEECNVLLLRQAGMAEAHIRRSGICTRHSCLPDGCGGVSRLPSWRRENGTIRRIVTWIGLGL